MKDDYKPSCTYYINYISIVYKRQIESIECVFDLMHIHSTAQCSAISTLQVVMTLVMTHTGTCLSSSKAIFDSLSSFGGDAIALKRSIAFCHLRSRTRAYRAIYDAVKIPRTDEDYCLKAK